METDDEYEHRYEVDTVEFNGEVVTKSYPLHGGLRSATLSWSHERMLSMARGL